MLNTEEFKSKTTKIQVFKASFHYIIVSVKRSLNVGEMFA